MKAVKGNKEYIIDETQAKAYQDSGFDIFDDYGEAVAYGRGKMIQYDEYMKLAKENEELRRRIAETEVISEAETEDKPASKRGTKKAGE